MPLEVLLVEDSPGDVRLTQEAFRDAKTNINLHVATDGVAAMAFLRHEGDHSQAPRPDFILLDLNLPKMDGREVLAHIKEDDEPENDSHYHPDHFRRGGGHFEKLSTSGELLHQQTRTVGGVRRHREERQSVLANDCKIAAAGEYRVSRKVVTKFEG